MSLTITSGRRADTRSNASPADDTASTSDEMAWGLGLGCNGTVRVLVEPLASGSLYIEALRRSDAAPVSAVIFGGGGKALGAQPVDRGFHIAVGLGQRLLAVHHAGAGALAKFLHGGGGDLSHFTSSRSPAKAGVQSN